MLSFHHDGPEKREGPLFRPSGGKESFEKSPNAQDLFRSQDLEVSRTVQALRPPRLPRRKRGEKRATHHSDKHPTLLRDAPHAGVADDADREPGREPGQPDREAGAELDKAGVERHGRFEAARDQDRDDEAVDLGERGTM